MRKKKSLFISFEGIEGSGKSYQSRILFKKIKKIGFPVIFTREPGGSNGAEMIRSLILSGKTNKFDKLTDTLLYLAARNEHVNNLIKPAIMKKKIIICDRFIDSTYAYQGSNNIIKKNLIDYLHKIILDDLKPDLTFILKVNINKAFQRVKKRKSLNRYDKFPRSFYKKAQKIFIKIAKSQTKRCVIIDNSQDVKNTENIIFKKFLNLYK